MKLKKEVIMPKPPETKIEQVSEGSSPGGFEIALALIAFVVTGSFCVGMFYLMFRILVSG